MKYRSYSREKCLEIIKNQPGDEEYNTYADEYIDNTYSENNTKEQIDIILQKDQLFKIRMNCNLEQLGITISQMHILLYLIKNHGEKMNQKKLSEQFGVKHSTMSGILARLKEKGFIEICVDEDNKKYKNIYPTAKAMLLDEQMALHRNETESLLQKGFSKEEIQQLGNYLDRLYHNLLSGSEI